MANWPKHHEEPNKAYKGYETIASKSYTKAASQHHFRSPSNTLGFKATATKGLTNLFSEQRGRADWCEMCVRHRDIRCVGDRDRDSSWTRLMERQEGRNRGEWQLFLFRTCAEIRSLTLSCILTLSSLQENIISVSEREDKEDREEKERKIVCNSEVFFSYTIHYFKKTYPIIFIKCTLP